MKRVTGSSTAHHGEDHMGQLAPHTAGLGSEGLPGPCRKVARMRAIEGRTLRVVVPGRKSAASLEVPPRKVSPQGPGRRPEGYQGLHDIICRVSRVALCILLLCLPSLLVPPGQISASGPKPPFAIS